MWGITKAGAESLPVMTEASMEGSAFYRKLGFEQIGEWNVSTATTEEKVSLSVMQLAVP